MGRGLFGVKEYWGNGVMIYCAKKILLFDGGCVPII
jgi:hypothetical protein